MSQAQTTKEFICYSWPRRLCGRDSILMAEIRRYALSKGTNNPSPRSWESCLFVLASLVCRQYSFITLFALLIHWLLGRYLTVHSTVPLFCLAVLGASVTRIPHNPHHQPSTSTDPLLAPRVKITRLEYSLREDYLSTALSLSFSRSSKVARLPVVSLQYHNNQARIYLDVNLRASTSPTKILTDSHHVQRLLKLFGRPQKPLLLSESYPSGSI